MNVASAPSAADAAVTRAVPLARLRSALVLAPPVLAAIWLGSPLFAVMVVVGAIVLSYEWWRLCGDGSRITAVALMAGVAAAPVAASAGSMPLALGCTAIATGALLALGPRRGWARTWTAAGPLYLGLPCALLIWLRGDPIDGRETILWLFAVVWASDIGAYLAGRTFGGPRLAPRISPGKTWSGAVGGVAAAAAVGCLVAYGFGHDHPARALAIAALFSLIAQLGDLAESWVKRR
ncbi:MAG: phosphatidate cytidylyltransferase, partial [Rhodospirillales bacterium]|nr:phosphatidate cytidylyltransferase [Rhodospirillales bacterium]